jgi:acetoin:2,6-dichlorophenolindophenol oxidoreductase subunit beta
MHEVTGREAIAAALRSEMEADPRMMVLGESVATWGGASGVTSGLREAFGAERVLETPVSENAIVSMTLGAALGGIPVIAEIYSADFLLCAASEVLNDIAKWRFQHRWQQPINLVLRMPMLSSGIAAGPEHTQAIEGYLHRANGLVVVVPGSVRDAAGALRAAIRCGDPVVFLEHRRLYDLAEPVDDVDLERYVRDLTRATVVSQGTDLTLVAWGWMRQVVTQVVASIEAKLGASIEVIDPVTIRPMDINSIQESVAKTHKLLVVEEAPQTGSVSGEIITAILEQQHSELLYARRLTMPDLPNPFSPELERQLVPSAEAVRVAIEEVLNEPVEVAG